jgi:hypothetical protein
VYFCVLHDLGSLSEEVEVDELLLHFGLDEGLHGVFKVDGVLLENEQVKLVAAVVTVVPVLLSR